MARQPMTPEEIRASCPEVDHAKVAATTEADIRRHQIEDGEDPDAPSPPFRPMPNVRAIRTQLRMTQEGFAKAIGVPVATVRNWEQSRTSTDPAVRSLLRVVEREPDEVASGAKTDRAQLRKVLAALEADDVLTVTRLDRLARSTRDLLNTLAAITGKKAGFRSLGDTWADTTTAHGRLMLTVLGGLAEFERELIRARTGEGRARAVARGVKMGRKPKLTPHQRQEILRRRENGEAVREIARSYNVHNSTISRLAA